MPDVRVLQDHVKQAHNTEHIMFCTLCKTGFLHVSQYDLHHQRKSEELHILFTCEIALEIGRQFANIVIIYVSFELYKVTDIEIVFHDKKHVLNQTFSS